MDMGVHMALASVVPRMLMVLCMDVRVHMALASVVPRMLMVLW